MTIREFYLSIINGTVSDETVAKASEMLASLDARNEKRKSVDSKEKRETRERVQKVLDFLCDHQGESFTRDDIASAVSLSVGQVTAACRDAQQTDRSSYRVSFRSRGVRTSAYRIIPRSVKWTPSMVASPSVPMSLSAGT